MVLYGRELELDSVGVGEPLMALGWVVEYSMLDGWMGRSKRSVVCLDLVASKTKEK